MLLLNSDTELRPGALGALARALDERPHTGVIDAALYRRAVAAGALRG